MELSSSGHYRGHGINHRNLSTAWKARRDWIILQAEASKNRWCIWAGCPFPSPWTTGTPFATPFLERVASETGKEKVLNLNEHLLNWFLNYACGFQIHRSGEENVVITPPLGFCLCTGLWGLGVTLRRILWMSFFCKEMGIKENVLGSWITRHPHFHSRGRTGTRTQVY